MGRIGIGLGLVLGLVACGPGSPKGSGGGEAGGGSSSDETATGQQGGSGGVVVPRGCECATPVAGACGFEGLEAALPQCQLPRPCPDITVECLNPGQLYPCLARDLVVDPDAITCALDALTASEPAVLRIQGNDVQGFERPTQWNVIYLLGDGTSVVSRCTDFADGVTEAAAMTLADPAFFDRCRGAATPGEQHECLFEGLAQPTVLPTCE